MLKRTEEILESLRACKGCERVVVWSSPKTPLKDHAENKIAKLVSAHVRAGIDFKNKEANKGREVGPLPWGNWVLHPFVIGHTRKDGTYNEYIRFDPPVLRQGSEPARPKVQWFLNGNPVDYQTVAHMLKAGDKPSDKVSECIDVNVNNIIAIQDVGQ